jgi:NADH-quinone oxidoreductase subunit H
MKYILIIGGVLFIALSIAAGLIWVERRLLSVWQDRLGPNRVGPFGIGQVVADTIKLFFKEDWVPPFSDKPVFILAPGILMATILLTFAVIPFGPNFLVFDSNIGILFFLGNSSLGVYSIVLGGWASNNKYSLIGAMRASAQMLTYEVFMGIVAHGSGDDGRQF